MLRLVLLAALLAGITGCGSATPTTGPAHKEEKKGTDKKPEDKGHDTEKPHGSTKK